MRKKILYVHQERRLNYGAHYINDLIIEKLRGEGYEVDTVYPQESVNVLSSSLTGIGNILFFYSLIHKKQEVHKYDLIQGTTYTVLPFLGNSIPVISFFGSTTYGFLRKVPSLKRLASEKPELAEIFQDLKRELAINNRSSSIKSLHDISRIEIEVAKKSTAVIATSEKVRKELMRNRVPERRIHLVHNAIEDYWFKRKPRKKTKDMAELVYLGRLGDDVFTIKLKGINRLIYIFRQFPGMTKTLIGMCSKVAKYQKIFSEIPGTKPMLSVEKKKIPSVLRRHYGDIYLNPGRYEGFCLSLIEAMSQGLVPITFPIGVAPEIIKDGRNGYLVTSIDEMARRIQALSMDKKKRARMAEEAMRSSRAFTSASFIRKLNGIYSSIFSKKEPQGR